MEKNEAVCKARTLVENITPLKTDCGYVCDAACCQPMEAEETGMLLFPGEESFYQGSDSYILKKTDAGVLLLCSGRCKRTDRPLSCRIFPLLPIVREDGIHVLTDERARPVCPLARQGKSSMDPDFVKAVLEAGTILASNAECRSFLEELTLNQDFLRDLRRKLQ